MNILTRKILVFLLLFVGTCDIVRASSINVKSFSMPVSFSNKVTQPINVAFSSDGAWRIMVEPLDGYINNLNRGDVRLPLDRLELARVNGEPIARFSEGSVVNMLSGDSSGPMSFDIAINAIRSDADPPGSYSVDLRFSLFGDNNISAEDIYTLRFNQNSISSIDFSDKVIQFAIDKENILNKHGSQELKTPLCVYISSNEDWKLFVKKASESQDSELSYFIKVLGADGSIKTEVFDYVPLDTTPVLIASGKPTVNSSANTLDRKMISISYLVKGPDGKFFKAGSSNENFEYRLETEN